MNVSDVGPTRASGGAVRSLLITSSCTAAPFQVLSHSYSWIAIQIGVPAGMPSAPTFTTWLLHGGNWLGCDARANTLVSGTKVKLAGAGPLVDTRKYTVSGKFVKLNRSQ